ncbi:dynein assembly factor 1, axonemal homolog [Drosophila pseudoobscura]|uniref:Dynein axonemal assembly factor 1 homolog n=1 Tax=Drosophila pseudoobscura pseudoobscura TaxID=46245 RepID=A0A6I8UIW8_DROPS|nr:dynein assembly factor 1, axonemal homolog [Drosophila pseudoobscura]
MCERGFARRREEVTGLNRITEKGLKDICKRDKLYQTPRLNDVLYLHFQGYQCIENLDEYTELKSLWLESNAISEIQNLTKLTKLKCLYLQNNLITKMENLEFNRELDTLNLSQNHIRKIENIGTDILPVLNTLNITSNYLTDSVSLAALVECKTLSVLDLSNNRIDDILIVKIFEQMPSLKVLVLQGNPVVSRLPQYRKTLILACKELTYLDSRPVFPRDRACAEAWKREGYEGERKEVQRWNRAERRKTRESVNSTIRMRNRHLKPEDQVPLLTSSDSEEEQKGISSAEKAQKRAEMEYGSVDTMWDEVSGESQVSEHSTTSSTSAEDNESAGSQADHIAERISNRRVKPLEGRPKVLYDEAASGDVDSIVKLVTNKEENEEKDQNISEIEEQHKGKIVLIEEMNENTNASMENQKAVSEAVETIGKPVAVDVNNTTSNSIVEPVNEQNNLASDQMEHLKGKRILIEKVDDIDPIKKELKYFDEAMQNKELKQTSELEEKAVTTTDSKKDSNAEDLPELKDITEALLQSDTASKPPLQPTLLQSDSGSEMDNTADLEQTCQTLLQVAQGNDDDGDPTPKQIKSQMIDEMYESFGSDLFEEHPLPIDQLLNESTKKYQLEAKVCCEEETTKTPRDLYKEFIEEVTWRPKSKEQLEREQECVDASEKCAHDLAEMGSHLEEDLQELRDFTENLSSDVQEQAKDPSESDEEPTEEEMEVKSQLLKEQFQDRKQRLKEAIEERKTMQKNLEARKEDLNKSYNLFAKIMDDATDNVPKRVFGAGCDVPSKDWDKEECMQQLPLTSMEDSINGRPSSNDEDILTRPLTELTSAEAAEEICSQLDRKLAGEEEALRQLLCDLENENEILYSIETQIKYAESISVEDSQSQMVCASLLNDLISDVIYKDITEMGPNSYPLGPIESDEEYTYSEEPKLEKMVPPHLENPAGGKSLRECVDTFKEFFASKGNDKPRQESHTHLEKIRAAKALLKSKSLAEFSKDTPESLDAQLAKDEDRRKRHVAASAGRCFAKREKYDDTLEVVDNRLMVVKKDTGELEELPPPPELISDSESEKEVEEDDDAYDTAEETLQEYPRVPWTTPYKPKPRKAAEHLVNEAMQRVLAEQFSELPDDTKENEPQEDEFFSLEAKETFGNLDSEFFQKLDLDKVTTANNAEAATECMRSYNELKACMKSGSTELQLTSEENEMLQEMLSSNEDLEAKHKSNDDPLVERDNELLNKMMQRMKEHEERARELQEQLEKEKEEENSGPIKLSMGEGSMLYQRWSPLSLTEIIDPQAEEGGRQAEEGGAQQEEGGAQSEEGDDQAEGVPQAEEGVTQGEECVLQEEETHAENGVAQAEGRVLQSPEIYPIIGYEDIDDDDAASDFTTDYSSDDEVAVVVPPKISPAMLKAYYYDGFEEDMRMVRENEARTRRGLRAIMQKEKQMWKDNEEEMAADMAPSPSPKEEHIPEVKTETETAKPTVETAKDKWAKIASRLNEFLDPEAMEQLESHEFGESDGEDDVDLTGLQNYDEESETECESALKETTEIGDSEKQENKKQDETLDPKDTEAITDEWSPYQTSFEENRTAFCDRNNKLTMITEQTSDVGDPETETTKLICQWEKIIPEDSNIGDGPTEKFLDQKAQDITENTDERPENPTNFITLDYFVDTEPSESLEDTEATETPEVSTEQTLKTEQMEFNLDVLNDDGDVVIKEVTVEAQVTYQ